MTYATCTTTCSLTAMGTVAIANAANNYATYAGIGFNINQDRRVELQLRRSFRREPA